MALWNNPTPGEAASQQKPVAEEVLVSEVVMESSSDQINKWLIDSRADERAARKVQACFDTESMAEAVMLSLRAFAFLSGHIKSGGRVLVETKSGSKFELKFSVEG